MKNIKKIIQRAADLGWSAELVEDNVQDYLEFETWSPAGENVVVSVAIPENAAEEVREYADDFNVDAHAVKWYETRDHVRGVPGILLQLMEDAAEIKKMLTELAEALEALES